MCSGIDVRLFLWLRRLLILQDTFVFAFSAVARAFAPFGYWVAVLPVLLVQAWGASAWLA